MHMTINMMWVYPEMGKLRNQDVANNFCANNGENGDMNQQYTRHP